VAIFGDFFNRKFVTEYSLKKYFSQNWQEFATKRSDWWMCECKPLVLVDLGRSISSAFVDTLRG
jgi:hypothetical protein